MKKICEICLILCLIVIPFSSFADAKRHFAGTVNFMIGDVFVSSDGINWNDADFDMKIYVGDQIKTGIESRCEITFPDGSIIRMEEKSLQQFKRVEPQKTVKSSSIFLSAGKIWLNARKIVSKNEGFQVRTDKAVCAIRGTTFQVDNSQESTQIIVFKGEIAAWSTLFNSAKGTIKESVPPRSRSGDVVMDVPLSKPSTVSGPHPVTMEKWVEIVKAFQKITIDTQGRYEKQDIDIENVSKDPWVVWNMTRDSMAGKQ